MTPTCGLITTAIPILPQAWDLLPKVEASVTQATLKGAGRRQEYASPATSLFYSSVDNRGGWSREESTLHYPRSRCKNCTPLRGSEDERERERRCQIQRRFLEPKMKKFASCSTHLSQQDTDSQPTNLAHRVLSYNKSIWLTFTSEHVLYLEQPFCSAMWPFPQGCFSNEQQSKNVRQTTFMIHLYGF